MRGRMAKPRQKSARRQVGAAPITVLLKLGHDWALLHPVAQPEYSQQRGLAVLLKSDNCSVSTGRA